VSSFNGWVKLMADRVKFMELRQPRAGFAFFSRLVTEFLSDLVIVFRSEWMSLKLRFACFHIPCTSVSVDGVEPHVRLVTTAAR